MELNNWFAKVNSRISNKVVFLLNIFELEALIMAVIDTLDLIQKYCN
ncbi:hypothetical protein SAMN05443550_10115 [Pedobacter hartonius]|uniref:Uncharacterized protein n=2 Tax=Pedobacter hartonius TaxID=425514 RepID=A0A1H3W068_9SPHI|nr:hypothetical protein SAMN05443550_10115 [Pedobacter hartonius]